MRRWKIKKKYIWSSDDIDKSFFLDVRKALIYLSKKHNPWTDGFILIDQKDYLKSLELSENEITIVSGKGL